MCCLALTPRTPDLEVWGSGLARRVVSLGKKFYSTFRGTQREYSSKPLKHSIVKRILVLKRQI